MNEKLDAALLLYPISLCSEAVFRKQFRLSARVCRHLERWPAAATFWNPPDKAENILQTNLFENVDAHKGDGMTAYGNLVKCDFNKKHGPFLLDILPYGVLLKTSTSSFVVKRLHCKFMVLICLISWFRVSSPCPERTVVTDSDGRKKKKEVGP